MAVGDIKIRTTGVFLPTVEWQVASGTSNSIHRGEPTIKGEATGTSTGVVKIAADGDPLTTSTHQFSGVAKNESSETASAAGTVVTYLPLPGIIYAAKAKTASTADTQSEINALKDKRVVLDLTSTTWSVDAAATDSKNNGIFIVGGDYRTTEIYFMVTPGVTFFQSIAEA